MSTRRRVIGFLVTAVLAGLALPASALAFGPLASFGSGGEGAGQMIGPGNLDVAPDGNLYVPDFFNDRIDVFSPAGQFQFAFGLGVDPRAPGAPGTCTAASECLAGVRSAAAGSVAGPESLTIGLEGRVYVSGLSNNRVDVFSPRGEFLFAFGKGVNPNDPASPRCTLGSGCQVGAGGPAAGTVVRSRLAADATGRLYLAGDDNRIDVFSPAGEFEFAFGKGVKPTGGDICTSAPPGCQAGAPIDAAGAILPVDVTITPGGQVAVLNSVFARVDVFSPQGQLQFAFGRGVNPAPGGGDVCTLATGCKAGMDGFGAGEIGFASAIDASPSGSILLAGQATERVDEFGADGSFVRAFGAGVIDGSEVFQVCTAATGCRKGLRSRVTGATAIPEGLGVDARGRIYVAEVELERIEVFGEPDPPAPPTSTASSGPGNARNQDLRVLKVTLDRRRGTAKVLVSVPAAGALTLTGKGVRKVERAAPRAGELTLPIALAGKAKRTLLRTGKYRVTAKVAFTPTAGAALSTLAATTLKKKRTR